MGGYDRETRTERTIPHLRFEEDTTYEGKTKRWHVISTHYPFPLLGTIKWRGAWLKYVIQYEDGTIMDKGCHKEVDDFIDVQMQIRKEERKKWPNHGKHQTQIP
jgi:hypothetical protein